MEIGENLNAVEGVAGRDKITGIWSGGRQRQWREGIQGGANEGGMWLSWMD